MSDLTPWVRHLKACPRHDTSQKGHQFRPCKCGLDDALRANEVGAVIDKVSTLRSSILGAAETEAAHHAALALAPQAQCGTCGTRFACTADTTSALARCPAGHMTTVRRPATQHAHAKPDSG